MGGTGYKGKFCTNPIQFIRLPMRTTSWELFENPELESAALGLRRQAEDKTT